LAEGLWNPGVPYPANIEGSTVVSDGDSFIVIGGADVINSRPIPYGKAFRFDGVALEWVEAGELDMARYDAVSIKFDASDFCQ